jgi:hypothetical protein
MTTRVAIAEAMLADMDVSHAPGAAGDDDGSDDERRRRDQHLTTTSVETAALEAAEALHEPESALVAAEVPPPAEVPEAVAAKATRPSTSEVLTPRSYASDFCSTIMGNAVAAATAQLAQNAAAQGPPEPEPEPEPEIDQRALADEAAKHAMALQEELDGMAHLLPEEERRELQKDLLVLHFAMDPGQAKTTLEQFDTNGDGVVSSAELRAGLLQLSTASAAANWTNNQQPDA